MLRSAASKVAWVGRTASMVFGLALVLALILGMATMALAAVPGDPFKLGKVNSINRISTLVGTATSPILRVENKGTGTALNLKVQEGKPPLTVNSNGRVPKLNSDMVDGKSDTDFYAAGSKVADSVHADQADNATNANDAANAANADKIDGKDSSEFAAYARTVVVSPVGTDAQNGQALLDALSGITDASEAKQYLLYVEPGTYNLGTGTLAMKQHVDIQGAGELKTFIVSSRADCNSGTVGGASDSELRFLTVRNTFSTPVPCNIAIYNTGASLRLTHVTAEASGELEGTEPFSIPSVGVRNVGGSNLTMTDATVTASGGPNSNFAVVNEGQSSLTIEQSKLSGSSYSLYQPDGTAKVVLTQFVGPARRESGTLQCFNNYDANLAAVTCP